VQVGQRLLGSHATTVKSTADPQPYGATVPGSGLWTNPGL